MPSLPHSFSRDSIDWHPERDKLYAELHSRPFKVIQTDALITHIALLCNERQRIEQQTTLLAFLQELSIDVERCEGSCQVYQTDDLLIRYEQHLEFTTLTITERYHSLSAVAPFSKSALQRLPYDWFERFPGRVIAAFHLHILFTPSASLPKPQTLKTYFDNTLMVGSLPQNGDAQIWTNFQTHEDGFGRFLVFNLNMTKGQMGRMVQRLIEIEQYRLLTLLGYMKARSLTSELKKMDQALASITDELAHGCQSNDQVLLNDLSHLAASIENIRAKTTFRFNASLAYYDVLRSRIEELKENEVSGHLTLKEFLTRRLSPAINSCTSAQERLENLSRRVNRASDMLRTRVELSVHSQNQQLLSAMERRSRIQLAMQHTVEGLSVAAISYYTIGLLKLMIDALYELGVLANKQWILGICIPVVVGGIWWLTRRIKNKYRALAR